MARVVGWVNVDGWVLESGSCEQDDRALTDRHTDRPPGIDALHLVAAGEEDGGERGVGLAGAVEGQDVGQGGQGQGGGVRGDEALALGLQRRVLAELCPPGVCVNGWLVRFRMEWDRMG